MSDRTTRKSYHSSPNLCHSNPNLCHSSPSFCHPLSLRIATTTKHTRNITYHKSDKSQHIPTPFSYKHTTPRQKKLHSITTNTPPTSKYIKTSHVHTTKYETHTHYRSHYIPEYQKYQHTNTQARTPPVNTSEAILTKAQSYPQNEHITIPSIIPT